MNGDQSSTSESESSNSCLISVKPNLTEASHLLSNDQLQLDHDAEFEISEPKKKPFPKSVFFIVGNEFCERFSYYGMRTVLTLYLTSQLGMSDSTATIIYHTFVMICYFTPVLGSMLADGLLGKFRTIFYVSLIYALGNIVLSMSATPPLKFPIVPMSMVGLFLISLGTGGIKPCVSAFGGDQFDNDQIRQREKFFFIFYFSINAGSLISTFITPILRADVHCFDQDTCFPLAFGLPAILMVISIILFVAGKSMYRMLPPKGNVVVAVSKCIGHAISRRWHLRKTNEKKEHWLDYADDKFEKKFITDVRAALRVMFLYIPLPVFWALFDQQGSRWTLQAQELDGQLTDSYVIEPDQMQVVNPLLILIFIPVFESGIYPLLARCNILTRPLKRMFVGGMLAALAFVIAGLLELGIESNAPSNPAHGHTDVVFLNNGPCVLQLRSLNQNNFQMDPVTLNPSTYVKEFGVPIQETSPAVIQVTPNSTECSGISPTVINLMFEDAIAYSVVFNIDESGIISHYENQTRKRPADGLASFRVAYSFDMPVRLLTLNRSETSCTFNVSGSLSGITPYCTDEDKDGVNPGKYSIIIDTGFGERSVGKVESKAGGRYLYAFYINESNLEPPKIVTYDEVAPNSIHMLWQVPQYVVITAGEIMFSITGLEFSYSQAPASMKSVLQAAWLLTDAFGNLIIIIIESINFFDKDSYEYFLFAGIMAVVMIVFAFMCMSYVYVTVDSEGNVIYPDDENDLLRKKEKDPKQTMTNGEALKTLENGVNGEFNQSFDVGTE